jgi:hypothetical protein
MAAAYSSETFVFIYKTRRFDSENGGTIFHRHLYPPTRLYGVTTGRKSVRTASGFCVSPEVAQRKFKRLKIEKHWNKKLKWNCKCWQPLYRMPPHEQGSSSIL